MDFESVLCKRLGRTGIVEGFTTITIEVANDEAVELLPEVAEVHRHEAASVELEPMVVAIEYEDAEGAFSRRRITTTRLIAQGRSGILQAWCHERRAPRAFALDSILAVIDSDGVVIDPGDFWHEIGIHPADFAPTAETLDARKLVSAFRPGLSVLTAMAKVDGRLADRELLVIIDWLEDEANSRGIAYDPAALKIVEARIRHLYPGRDAIRGYLRTVLEGSGADRFVRALRRVILADGEIALEEARLMQILDAWAKTEP